MRVSAVNGMNRAPCSASWCSRMPNRSFARTTIERPSGVSSASDESWAASASSRSSTPVHGHEARCLPVAEGDGARLVEQEHRHVAGGLDGAAAGRQHVLAHEAVHAGDADGRQQRADGGRDQRDEQRREHGQGDADAGVVRHRHERGGDDDEHDREAGEEDRQGDLVRRPLPDGALDEADHPVEERLAGVGGDRDDDAVGQHARAAGDARPVAARLADHGRGLAGDGRLVDAGDALDDLAVGRDQVARLADDAVALAQVGRGYGLLAAVDELARHRRGAGLPQGVGLGLAAALGERLGEVREQDRQPQPDRDLDLERRCRPCPGRGRRSAGR